jgi:hypothetical protein
LGTIRPTISRDIMYMPAIRKTTCFVAFGSALRGLVDSAAASPMSSVPAKAKAAVTKTVQKPLKPSHPR